MKTIIISFIVGFSAVSNCVAGTCYQQNNQTDDSNTEGETAGRTNSNQDSQDPGNDDQQTEGGFKGIDFDAFRERRDSYFGLQRYGIMPPSNPGFMQALDGGDGTIGNPGSGPVPILNERIATTGLLSIAELNMLLENEKTTDVMVDLIKAHVNEQKRIMDEDINLDLLKAYATRQKQVFNEQQDAYSFHLSMSWWVGLCAHALLLITGIGALFEFFYAFRMRLNTPGNLKQLQNKLGSRAQSKNPLHKSSGKSQIPASTDSGASGTGDDGTTTTEPQAVDEEDEMQMQHQIEISKDRIAFRTSMNGTFLLFLAFVFYYLFLVFVYPVTNP